MTGESSPPMTPDLHGGKISFVTHHVCRHIPSLINHYDSSVATDIAINRYIVVPVLSYHIKTWNTLRIARLVHSSEHHQLHYT